MNRPALLYLTALSALASSGCLEKPRPVPYELVVRVEGDPDQPLAGATLWHGTTKLGVSGPDGQVRVRASGREGERIDLQVTCPEGHRQSSEPLSVVLRRSADKTQAPEYSAPCPPLRRKVVVALRLDKGPNIPVRYLGRELSRTDASGAAHVVIEDAAETNVELTFDTSEQPRLRPKSPTARFRIGDRDELLVINQSFEAPALAPRQAGPRRQSGPIRIR